MAPPVIPASSSSSSRNPLANLTPKQKRAAAAAAVGLVLGLIVLLSRRGAPAPPPAEATSDTSGNGPDYAPPTDMPPSTFADNGAAAGALSSEVTDALWGVSSSLDANQQSVQSLEDALGEQLPAIGAGLAGQVGMLKSQIQALKKQEKKEDRQQARRDAARAAAHKRRQERRRDHRNNHPGRPDKGGKPAGGHT